MIENTIKKDKSVLYNFDPDAKCQKKCMITAKFIHFWSVAVIIEITDRYIRPKMSMIHDYDSAVGLSDTFIPTP